MKNSITIGMDLGDRSNFVVVLDQNGTEIAKRTITNSKPALIEFYKSYPNAIVAIEAGTHSQWISRLLQDMGHKVYVGNPRKLRVIWDSVDKSDQRDARMLARVCRLDPELLWPVSHRSAQAHDDLQTVKARNVLVKSRTSLINHLRSIVKTKGERLPKCSPSSFAVKIESHLPKSLHTACLPILEIIGELTQKIKDYDKQIRKLCEDSYPETQYLEQVTGIGPITALAYVLTIDNPNRFSKSRMVGAYLGLTPRRDQSGGVDKQLRITKAGNSYLRQLLVGSSQYIMGPFGPDCDLRRYGIKIGSRGGKNAKKRAVVAVARKLSVLLHRLWESKETYEPFRNNKTHSLAA